MLKRGLRVHTYYGLSEFTSMTGNDKTIQEILTISGIKKICNKGQMALCDDSDT